MSMLLSALFLTGASGVAGCGSDDETSAEETPEQPGGSKEEETPALAVFETVDLTAPLPSPGFAPKEALALLKVTIRNEGSPIADASPLPDQRRVFFRSVSIDGLRMKGTLDVGSVATGKPVWREAGSQAALGFTPVTFYDGRRDGAEGSAEGSAPDETPQGLNPMLTENHSAVTGEVFGAGKNPGLTKEDQALFVYSTACSVGDGFFYIIPRNMHIGVGMTIALYTEQIEPEFPGLLTDGETSGICVYDTVSLSNILGEGVDFEPGKSYLVSIVFSEAGTRVEKTVGDMK